MGFWKVLAGVTAVALLLVATAYYTFTSNLLQLTLPELEAYYALPNSQFMDIGGVRVHYTEDGAKDLPPIVILHAASMNLRTWDDVAKDLSAHFHVIRLDMLGAGLTGPDPKHDYTTEHDMMIVDELTRHLGVEKFNLLGTSLGGTVAYRYAAEHPDRVLRLILIAPAGLSPTIVNDPRHTRGNVLNQWLDAHFKMRLYWTDTLYRNTGAVPPSKEQVQMIYDMNRREGMNAESRLVAEGYHPGGPDEALAKITAPTFIMWGNDDATFPDVGADAFALRLSRAPSLIKKYPHMGHYFYMEVPHEVARDLTAFLTGTMDADLRMNARVPASGDRVDTH